MNISIIVIGDEILLGQVTDTNSGAIARTFGPEGWTIKRVTVTGDNRNDITSSIINALNDSELVVTTGGLGPTKDDITKSVLAEIFGGTLVHKPDVAENIKTIFKKRGIPLNRLTETQAMVPSSCQVIQNRFGTAPIMWFENENSALVAMPGVPFETEGMLPEVLAFAMQHLRPQEILRHHTMIAGGVSESALAEHLEEFETSLPEELHLAYLPVPGYIRLRLDSRGNITETYFNQKVDRLRKAVGEYFVCDGDKTPAEILIDLLRDNKMTLATAESCTGGNIAHRITLVAGASEVFNGGIVSYSNEVKATVLGVEPKAIARHGAVSEEVVRQMALGACRATSSNCAIATSGIAGPGGGTPDKPVGTVWTAWAIDDEVWTRCLHLPGDRARVIDRATTEAILNLAFTFLKK